MSIISYIDLKTLRVRRHVDKKMPRSIPVAEIDIYCSIVCDSKGHQIIAHNYDRVCVMECGHFELLPRRAYNTIKYKYTDPRNDKVIVKGFRHGAHQHYSFRIPLLPCKKCCDSIPVFAYVCLACGELALWRHSHMGCINSQTTHSQTYKSKGPIRCKRFPAGLKCRGKTHKGNQCVNTPIINNLGYCRVHLRNGRTVLWIRKAFMDTSSRLNLPYPGPCTVKLIADYAKL